MRHLLVLLLAIAPAAYAAESHDACTGFIDALPASITAQGTWCLRMDLSTGIDAGNAVDIRANNVTIDCNGYKLGGLAGGPQSMANGVAANNRLNITIRNCAIRGFGVGILLTGDPAGGHLVEDNRIDHSTAMGMWVMGEGNLVQRNRISDTGEASHAATGIIASGDIRDNTIDGLIGWRARGIEAEGAGTSVSGNRIRNFVSPENVGIALMGSDQSALDNRIGGAADGSGGPVAGRAIMGLGADAVCRYNTTSGFAQSLYGCADIGGNLTH